MIFCIINFQILSVWCEEETARLSSDNPHSRNFSPFQKLFSSPLLWAQLLWKLMMMIMMRLTIRNIGKVQLQFWICCFACTFSWLILWTFPKYCVLIENIYKDLALPSWRYILFGPFLCTPQLLALEVRKQHDDYDGDDYDGDDSGEYFLALVCLTF